MPWSRRTSRFHWRNAASPRRFAWPRALDLARGAGLLVAIVSAGIAHAGERPAAATPTPIPELRTENDQLRRIVELMRDADLDALFTFYDATKEPMLHAIAAMAIERVRFNLDAATKDAKTCEDALFASKPAVALFCARIQVGNLRLAGHAQAANERLRSALERFRDRHMERQLEPLQRSLDVDSAIPLFAVDPIGADVEVKLKHDVATPVFEARANGHDFSLTLDTGASDLVLSQHYAERFGVKPLDAKSKANGWLAKDVAVQHGVLDTLQIGTLSLHNVPVAVVPTREVALFGANLAAALGTLEVSRSNLRVLAPASAAATCERPMQAATDIDGRYLRIVPTLLVNDSPQSVLLDTGASWFLVGSKAALDQVQKLRSGWIGVRDIGGTHPYAHAEAAKVKLQIGNQPFLVYFIVYTQSEMKHAITLGGDALRDMDFILDFRRQHLCFRMHDKLH